MLSLLLGSYRFVFFFRLVCGLPLPWGDLGLFWLVSSPPPPLAGLKKGPPVLGATCWHRWSLVLQTRKLRHEVVRCLPHVTSQNWVDLNLGCPTPESTSSLPRLHWGGLSLPEIPHHSTRNLKMSVLSKNLEKSRFWRGYLYAYGVKAWFPLSGRD